MITATPAKPKVVTTLGGDELIPGKLYEITSPMVHAGGIALGVRGGLPIYLVANEAAVREYPDTVRPGPIKNEVFSYKPYEGSVIITSE